MDGSFVIHCLDSITPIIAISEIRLLLASVGEHAGPSLTGL